MLNGAGLSSMNAPVTWVLTDGKAGTRNGALGLAEAVGLPVVDKHVASAWPWRWLPPALWPPGVLGVGPGGDALEPPWPRVLISAGERAVGPALEVRRRSNGATYCVHIQHPRVDPARFDLVTAPAHDRLAGPNVRVTLGALHRVTRDRIGAESARLGDRFSSLPYPRVAVLIGGANRAYRFGLAEAGDLGRKLAEMARATGCGLLVTTSRRTGLANEDLLRDCLAGLPVSFWDGAGENPYFAYLGLADAIVVTGDSVNMVTEACFTGRPVHVYRLPGRKGTKFDRFHEALMAHGLTRPFTGALGSWSYPPLDERTPLADEIRRAIGDSAARR